MTWDILLNSTRRHEQVDRVTLGFLKIDVYNQNPLPSRAPSLAAGVFGRYLAVDKGMEIHSVTSSCDGTLAQTAQLQGVQELGQLT